jgi:nicotinamide phosphoribosyltransferase
LEDFQMNLLDNFLLNTDSYKASHFLQYPPDMTGMFSYVESRGGAYDRTVFFGLQTILKEYLSKPVTLDQIAEAQAFWAEHGEPFAADGWRHIVETCGGYLPVTIRAVPEGAVVPVLNVLATLECTDPKVFWVVSHLETALLRLWYPTTVATLSWHIKQTIRDYLRATSDDPEGQLPFKLHDFGARGVSSAETAALGGCAHLVNFRGTDTASGILAARRYYGEPMAGWSIPAAEHSTITAWGREGETEAYRNMLRRFAKPGKLVAVVSDSYDVYHAVEHIWGGTLREEVIRSGATVVIRPDSGHPPTVVLKVAELLDGRFGSVRNGKGYKVLNHVRIIQGDGVNAASIEEILATLKAHGYAADNIAFGMGGALLQRLDRDTLKFALKCSAVRRGETWRPVSKNPATDPGKQSKAGRLSLFRSSLTGEYRTFRIPDNHVPNGKAHGSEWEEALDVVWDKGRLLKDWSFAEIRARAEAP